MDNKHWSKAEIEEDLGPLSYRISTEEVSRYSNSVDDYNPWYVVSSPFGGAIAPPLIIANEYTRLYQQKYSTGNSLHAKMEFELVKPPRVGSVVTTQGKIADKYIKREKGSVVIETISKDEDGEEIARSRMTLTYLK